MNRIILLATILTGLAAAQFVYSLVRYYYERQAEDLRRRPRSIGEPNAAGVQILRARRLAGIPALADFLGNFEAMVTLEKLLEQTDLEITVARLLLMSGALGIAGAVGGMVCNLGAITVVLFFAGIGVPFLVVMSSRERRAKRISEQLPDALEMMARSIKAGHSLPSSFKLVAHESPPPVAIEFGRAYDQQNLGIPFEQAVQQMCERVPSNLDLRLFAVSVMIQKETGGNLVEILEGISGTMRERFKFYSKLSALTAEGRVSGIILGAMPYAVALLVFMSNPDYLSELFSPSGRTILFGGFATWCAGVLWIRALLQVEY